MVGRIRWRYYVLLLAGFIGVNCGGSEVVVSDRPKFVYIAASTVQLDSSFQHALASAIDYINKDPTLLPATKLELIINSTSSMDKNLLTYVQMLSHHDVIALLLDSRTTSSHELLGAMLHIPMVTMYESHHHYPSNRNEARHSVCLGSSGYDVGEAMIDVIKEYKWTDILVIYDIRWRNQAKSFISLLPLNTKYSKYTVEVEKENTLCSDTKRQLQSFNNSPVEVVALFVDSNIVESVIDKVHCVCSFRIEKPHNWLIADMLTSLSMSAQSSQTILGFMPSIASNRYTTHLGKDVSVDVSSFYNSSLFAFDAALVTAHALHKVIDKGLWVKRNTTTDVTVSLNGPRIYKEMKKLNVNSTTGLITMGEDASRRNMKLDILNLQYNKFTKVGKWDSTNRLAISKAIIQNNPTSELIPLDKLNRRLKVVVVIDPPFVMRNKEGKLHGYSIDLIQKIAERLKFRYEIYLSPDGLYGGKNADGSYNGIVGQLSKGIADMSTSPLTINSDRLPIIDFSKPFMQFTMSLITKKLDFDSQDLMAFMLPYSSTVWFLTLASLGIVTGVMYVVNYISPYGFRLSNKSKNGEAFNFFNSLWFCLASMLQQGADNTPRSLSGRVLAGCFWFFILIWISTYTANLAAFFTVRNASKAVSTLEEVVEGDYPFYIIRDTALHHFFRASSYQIYMKLYQRVTAQQTFVNSTTDGYSIAKKKKNAVFMAEKPSTEYVIMQEPCDLTAASGLLGASSYGIAMPKHYPYTLNISVTVLQLHENGELDSLWRKWWDNRSQCPKEQTRPTIGTGKQIELHNMIGVYMVLATGGISSIVLVLGEIFWSKHEGYFKTLFRNEFGSIRMSNHQLSHESDANTIPVLRVESRTTVL